MKKDVEKKANDFFYNKLLHLLTNDKDYFDTCNNYSLGNTIVLFIYDFIHLYYNRYTQGHNLVTANKETITFKLTVTDDTHITHDIILHYDVKQLIRISKIKKLKEKLIIQNIRLSN
jgi:hypothetical protein